MTRTAFSGALLLLEGDRDNRYWQKQVDHARCRVIKAGGKPQVLGAMDHFRTAGLPGLVAVVDNDFDGIVGPPVNAPNVFAPDAHDLEAMLVRSDALEDVLAEFGDYAKILAAEAAFGRPLRDLLLERAIIFARVRWWLVTHNVNIGFERFKPTLFIDPASWGVDEVGLIAEVAATVGQPVGAVTTEIQSCPTFDPWMLCHGKDLISVLSVGFRTILGSTQPGYERIAAGLRQGHSRTRFNGSALQLSIEKWEADNAPFQVLKR